MQKLKTISICVILFFICVIPAYREVGEVYAQPEKSVIISPWPGKPKNLTEDTQFDGDVTGKYNDLQIKEGAVGSPEVADGSVTGEKISDNAVTPEKIRDNSISTEKLQDNSVTDQKVSDDITVSKYLPLTGGLLTGALESQGTITATSFIGDGSQLTNIQATSINPESDITVSDLTVNGNLGIGTTSPEAKLHIDTGSQYGSGEVIALKLYPGGATNTGDGTAISLGTGAGQGIISSKRLALGGTHYGTDLMFRTTDTDIENNTPTTKMRIDSAGNVGIGSTSPSAKLTTSGTTEQLRLEYDPSNYQSFTVGSNGNLYITQNGEAATLALTNGGVGIGTLNPSEKLQVSGNIKADSFIGDGSKLTGVQATSINPESDITISDLVVNGNLGIGITSPAVPLDIDKNATTIGAGETEMLRLYAGSNAGDGPYINLQTGAGKAIISSTRLALGGVHYGSDLLFKTTDNEIENNQPTTKMRIDSAGNVGIGTTSPETKLHVNGIIRVDSSGKIDCANGNLRFDTNATDDIEFMQNGVVKAGIYDGNIKADSFIGNGSQLTNIQATSINPEADITVSDLIVNGNLGIGTAGPIGPLHVDHSGSNFQAIIVGDESNSSNNTGIYGRTNGIFDLNTGGAGIITLSPGGSEKVRLASNGNVGIGTNAPEEKLEVEGNVRLNTKGSVLYMRNLSGDDPNRTPYLAALQFRNWYFGSEALQLSLGDGNYWLLTDNGGIFRNNLGGADSVYDRTTGVYLMENGNFSVGMEPDFYTKFVVKGGVAVGSAFSQASIGDGNMAISGNVGIGTTSPGAKLHIDSTGYDIFLSGSSSDDVIIDHSDPELLYIYNVSNGEIPFSYFSNGNLGLGGTAAHVSPAIMILPGGNVGIGSISPSEKLQVSGNIKADSFIGDGSQLTNIQATSINPEADITVSDLVVNGNLGVGTMNPDTKLQIDVADAGVDDGILIRNSKTSNNQVELRHSTGNGGYFFLYDEAGARNLGLRSYGNSYFNGGNLGIGTVEPAVPLDIDKNATTIGAGETEMLRLYAGSNAGDGPYINLQTGAGKAIISSTRVALGGVHYGSDLLFKTTDNEIENNQPTTKMRIDSAGNVGIGTASPQAKLDVNGKIRIASEPPSRSDDPGERGTITFDDEFIYVKTNSGWRKARLCSLE